MRVQLAGQFHSADTNAVVDVSIVLPCLNEAACLAICIGNAAEALSLIALR